LNNVSRAHCRRAHGAHRLDFHPDHVHVSCVAESSVVPTSDSQDRILEHVRQSEAGFCSLPRCSLSPSARLSPRPCKLLRGAVEPEQWLQRHPQAGASWPSWPQGSQTAVERTWNTYRVASLMSNRTTLGPYSRHICLGPYGGPRWVGVFEVPL
jgi:hypothetical protein